MGLLLIAALLNVLGSRPSAQEDIMSTGKREGQIAFVSDRDGSRKIYVMNADGSHQTRLTSSTLHDWHLSWSPDGTQVVFNSFRGKYPDGFVELYQIDVNSQLETRLTFDQGDHYAPVWSPDGKHIAFTVVVRGEGSNKKDI